MNRAAAVLFVTGLIALAPLSGGCQSNSAAPVEPNGQITMNEVPAVVRDGFRTQFPEAAIQIIERTTGTNGNVRYTFTFTGREGNKRQAKFDAKGHLLDTK